MTPRALCVSIVVACAAWPAAAAEWSVAATATRSSADPGEDTSVQELRLTVSTGRRVTVFASFGAIRADGPGTPRGAGRGSFGARFGSDGGNGPVEGAGGGTGRVGPTGATGADAERAGLGDLTLGLWVPLAGGNSRLFAVDGRFEMKAPTADPDRQLGTGEWDARAGIAVEYRVWSGTFFGEAGWNRFGDPPGQELEDGVDTALGYESEPGLRDLAWSAWVEGAPGTPPDSGTSWAAGIGLRSTGRRAWRVGLTRGLGNTGGDYHLLIGVGLVRSGARPATRGFR